MSILLAFLAAFGVIYVIVESAIFAPIRIAIAVRSSFLETLVYCAYCTGFWVGVLITMVFIEWTWAEWWNGALLLKEFIGGSAVMGAIAVIRGFAPEFLLGAWEREREIRDAIRGAEPVEHADGAEAGSEGGADDA